MDKTEFEKMLQNLKKNMKATEEILNQKEQAVSSEQKKAFFSSPLNDPKAYRDVETYNAKANHDDANQPTFVDAGNLGENLTNFRKDYETRKKEEEKKKDLSIPANWTPDMISFYYYLIDKCTVAAKEGRNCFVCNGTGTPKTFNFVLDYLRDHNNIMYVRESCKGFADIPDGVYFRLIWG